MERTFLSCVDRSRFGTLAAYLWPDAALETVCELKQRNVTIFREQFNCHTGTAKTILDQAYDRLGVIPLHGITDEMIDEEVQLLEAVDHVFCPSPAVEASLLANGVPPYKLLKATYGWDPARLAGSDKPFASSEGVTALFVGTICVRKGAHLLLNYWAQSGIKGRLVLAGEMEPIIKEKCVELLGRDDVLVLDYLSDVGALYRSADIFVLPSFEEGSPLVIYEACGSGLPVVTSTMGAGSIIRHNSEGFVVDPYDASGWIAALRALANDKELRRKMATAAANRAQSLVWDAVASERRSQVLGCLRNGS
jgi:glycosyltransferase involved in cell wall biosynthesis